MTCVSFVILDKSLLLFLIYFVDFLIFCDIFSFMISGEFSFAVLYCLLLFFVTFVSFCDFSKFILLFYIIRSLHNFL